MRARIANALEGSRRARERLAVAVLKTKMVAAETYEMTAALDDAILDLRDAIIASQARRSRPEPIEALLRELSPLGDGVRGRSRPFFTAWRRPQVVRSAS
jgi:hypothetical protein